MTAFLTGRTLAVVLAWALFAVPITAQDQQ